MKMRSALLTTLCLCAAPETYAQDGSSCANAIPMFLNVQYTADTTQATNWMGSFGPLVSPSHDIVYTFIAGSSITENDIIIPLTADYPFAIYLIPSCNESGTEPVPIGATGTIGVGIDLAGVVLNGLQYYVAVTGTAAGGAGANGTLNFVVPFVPVTLQSFEVD